MKKLTIQEFIEKANKIHNHLYDYSNVDYINSRAKIKIKCPKHGIFEQIASKHLRGQGCSICGGKYQSTTQEFIEKANKLHNHLYDYSNVEYINALNKIQIKCPKHGIFEQTPHNHLKRQGCPKCGGTNKSTKENFIFRSNIIHDNFYNYTNLIYKNNKFKVEIVCPIHGVFKQTPNSHLSGVGCLKCSGKYLPTTQEFVEKANKIHNHLYDYSETNYINSISKIKINCPIHGVFKQTPSNHIQGQKCPKCKETKGEKLIRRYLELNNIDFKQQYVVKCKDYWFIFDFVVNNNVIIEYNGIQHYCPVTFGSKKENAGFENLLINLKRDCLKYKKLKENNISLLVIPYWDIKRISEILDDFFKGVESICSQPPQIVVKYEKYRKMIEEKIHNEKC